MDNQYTDQDRTRIAQFICERWNHRASVAFMFGPANADLRQAIMSEIAGQKLPKAKCGITALVESLYAVFPLPREWTCQADREDLLQEQVCKYGISLPK